MIYGSWSVNAVALLAICTAVVLSPLYAMWIGGGLIADRRERARVTR